MTTATRTRRSAAAVRQLMANGLIAMAAHAAVATGLTAVAALLAMPRTAAAHAEETRLAPRAQAQLAEARRATARFHDFAAAVQAGYGPGPVIDVQGKACIDQPGQGAMGVHFVNGNLLNPYLDERTPQALIYLPTPDGALRLVGAEYIVFKSVWDGFRPGTTPSLFGRQFHLVNEGNRYGLPAFYALHAWLWTPNPSGLFADWNPDVRCP